MAKHIRGNLENMEQILSISGPEGTRIRQLMNLMFQYKMKKLHIDTARPSVCKENMPDVCITFVLSL